ncbi:MAG: peptide-methionine (S)-S-oxide reductase MsrA [Proteobacteria bacterium]|nr:peptide-methionine (S)-S-oxide reductase MsrA [Pseudomonadota bacterium]
MSPIRTLLLISLLLSVVSQVQADSKNPSLETALIAGGCFWCIESDFDKVPGVVKTVSGYSNGDKKNPTYRQVSAGGTGHVEVVQITYDRNIVSYQKLLDVFWRSIDPTVKNRQFCDRGDQYRSAIFYMSPQQKKIALASRAALNETKPFTEDIVTEISQATTFYPAEDYHQNYYKKNPLRYKYYRYSCGRDQRLKELWGDSK